MNKKRIVFISLVLFGIIANFLIIGYAKPSADVKYRLNLEVSCNENQKYQVYYGVNQEWSEQNSQTASYKEKGETKVLSFNIPASSSFLRIDFGEKAATHNIEKCCLEFMDARFTITGEQLLSAETKQMIASIEAEGESAEIVIDGEDSFCILDVSAFDMQKTAVSEQKDRNFVMNIIRCAIIDIILLAFIIFFKRLIELPAELWRNRTLIKRLALNDFKTRYASNYLGIFWAFVQPVVTILVYWFVFQVGFRSGAVMDCPFVLWLICGLVPWFYFSDGLNGGTSSMIEYSYLVKKVVFKISILPIVKILSSIIVHAFFVAITIVLFAAFGMFPDWYTLQIVYYTFCMTMLVLALSYATSAVMVFFRDLGQIIGIYLQVGIWITPIMWQSTMLPDSLQWILKINPIYYVVKGYRDSLIDKVWFFENLNLTIYFWCFTLGVFAIGALLFKRLKPHFADVL